MTLHMLDTNIVSHVIRGDAPDIDTRLTSVPMEDLVISALTKGELLYGLARRGHPKVLTEAIREFLRRVDTLPWDGDAATAYAGLRTHCAAKGIGLSTLDMLIAAHAIAVDAILVTRDKAFSNLPDRLKTDAWSA